MNIRIENLTRDNNLAVKQGSRLLRALFDAGIDINICRAGRGTCLGCLAEVEEGRVSTTENGITEEHTGPVILRACRARVFSDAVVRVPQRSVIEGSGQIEASFDLSDIVSGSPKGRARGFGIAIDIGTTTVAGVLVDQFQIHSDAAHWSESKMAETKKWQ